MNNIDKVKGYLKPYLPDNWAYGQNEYVRYMQCPLYFWFRHKLGLSFDETNLERKKYEDDLEIVFGKVKIFYDGGVNVLKVKKQFKEACFETETLISKNTQRIYNACFSCSKGKARVDMLLINVTKDKLYVSVYVVSPLLVFHAVEISKGTYQNYILKNWAAENNVKIRIEEIIVLHPNSRFVLKERNNLEDLISETDITGKCSFHDNLYEIPSDKKSMFLMEEAPSVVAKQTCVEPTPCPLRKQCWGLTNGGINPITNNLGKNVNLNFEGSRHFLKETKQSTLLFVSYVAKKVLFPDFFQSQSGQHFPLQVCITTEEKEHLFSLKTKYTDRRQEIAEFILKLIPNNQKIALVFWDQREGEKFLEDLAIQLGPAYNELKKIIPLVKGVTDVFLSNQGTGYNLPYGRQSKNALRYGMNRKYTKLSEGLLLDSEIQECINKLTSGQVSPDKKLTKHCQQQNRAMKQFIDLLKKEKEERDNKRKILEAEAAADK